MKRLLYRVLFIGAFVVVVAMWTGACGSRRVGRGDFSGEFLEALSFYGARFVETNCLPKLDARWVMYRDKNGFQCVLYGVGYEEVEGWAMRAFGGRGQSFRGELGKRGCLFRAWEVGVALFIREETNRIQVNCLKGMTNWISF